MPGTSVGTQDEVHQQWVSEPRPDSPPVSGFTFRTGPSIKLILAITPRVVIILMLKMRKLKIKEIKPESSSEQIQAEIHRF